MQNASVNAPPRPFDECLAGFSGDRVSAMRATVLLNRGGGSVTDGDAQVEQVTSVLLEAGVDASVSLVDGGEIESCSRAAVERGDPVLIVGGGDGTVSAAAGALAGSDTALGILPLGTLNHFARDLGIPLDLKQAALAIAQGREQRVDVAEMSADSAPARVFVNNSAIGLYPLMVLDRDAQQKKLGRSKWLAMVVASMRTLARFKHQRLSLTVNDHKKKIDTPLLFVGNNDYRLEMPGAGTRESLSDGRLCVMVMRSDSRLGFLASTARALAGRTRPDDMVKLEDVQTLRVNSRKICLAVSVDGETCHFPTPLDYRIRKGALRVMAPGEKAQ
jgi:diacylglycerol kinase family enzyme